MLIIFAFGSATIVYSHMQENFTVQEEIIEETNTNSTITVADEIEKEEKEYALNEEFNDNWYIEIPKIELSAPIAQGTTQEVMSQYVGHFENTTVWEGNIGLAAHNRRMPSKLFWKN